MTIAEFRTKYGTRGVSLMVMEYMLRHPPTELNIPLAAAIEDAMEALQQILKEYPS